MSPSISVESGSHTTTTTVRTQVSLSRQKKVHVWKSCTSLQAGEELNHWRSAKTIFSDGVELLFKSTFLGVKEVSFKMRKYNIFSLWFVPFSFSMTNGGKSTLSKNLHEQIPNSCIIAQDSFFKVGFKSHSSLHTFTVMPVIWECVCLWLIHLFYRKIMWYQWTATGLSNMTVRMLYLLICYPTWSQVYTVQVIG